MTTDTPSVTYDSVSHAFCVVSPTTGASSTISYGSGTIAASIGLTQASGATVSQGAVAAVPGTMMDAVADATQDWASFATIFNPDESGNTNKLAFATWCNAQNNRFLYVAWDTDITPTESSNATTSLGNILKTNNTSGVAPIYSAANGPALACFLMGAIASLDFSETNGRATMAFRAQSDLAPEITSRTVADNLKANGYNYYGIWGTANDSFNFLYPGLVSGDFAWIDSYVNQIWLNNQFQLALMVLLTNAKSIPYNQAGYTLIRAACQDPINQGLNFGAFRTGVTLSEQQKAIVNNSAGFRVDDVLTRQGYYLLVQDATPQVRAARGSPPCTFWYTDGGSVQQINLASILVQ